MDWGLFGSTFALIFVSELPDKTAFATLLLAARNPPFAVFVGAALAFCIQSCVGVVLGGTLRAWIPPEAAHRGAGVLFLVFAALMWRKRDDELEEAEETAEAEAPAAYSGRRLFLRSAGSAFVTIFLAEWGDLTQLATATLAAKYTSGISIFCGATLALWTVTALATLLGHRLGRILNPHLMQKFAALAFACIGIYLLSGL